ncbi:MAG: tetratricopeptide repeat protein [Acidobacteriaceae bacterium]
MAMKPATSTSDSKHPRAPRTLAGNAQHANDVARKSTLTLYESALKLMQAGKYEKAHEAFAKMLESAPQDLADRIRMYISACVAQIDKGTTDFQTHEERYDYAISLLNQGNYEDARQHLQEIILEEKSADYAFYGLALLASLTGDHDGCIDHLTEAIRLNQQNRFQARLDSDFDGVSEDPRFTELLYPEA